MDHVLFFRNKVENITNLYEFIVMSERSLKEKTEKDQKIAQVKKLKVVQITDEQESLNEKYRQDFFRSIEIDTIVKRNKIISFVASLTVIAIYCALAFIFIPSQYLESRLSLIGLILFMPSIVLIILVTCKSLLARYKMVKKYVKLLFLNPLILPLSASGMILYLVYNREYPNRIVAKYEAKMEKQKKADASFQNELSRAISIDEKATKAKKREINAKINAIKNEVTEHEWLSNEWQYYVSSARISARERGVSLSEYTDEDIIQRMIRCAGHNYFHFGINIIDETYENIMNEACTAAVDFFAGKQVSLATTYSTRTSSSNPVKTTKTDTTMQANTDQMDLIGRGSFNVLNADFKIYIVDREWEADMKVCFDRSPWYADKKVWIVQNSWEADKKVLVISDAYDADMKVYPING